MGFSLAGAGLAGRASAAAPTAAGYLPDVTQVDSWLVIHADNTVSFKTSQIEVGNGVTTGLGQLIAEELDVSPDVVRHVPWDTWNMVNSGSTGGSTGIQSSAGPPLRAAAATARQASQALASTNLGVPVASLSVSNGVVSGGGKTVTYGQLLGGKLFNTKINPTTLNPGQGISKPVSAYKVIGQPLPRVDIPAKVAGTYTYVHNVRIPGMYHARVVRPRGQGAVRDRSGDRQRRPEVDRAPPERPGRPEGRFPGVVAPHEYDAIQAAASLKVTWKDSPILPTPGNLWKQMRAQDTAGLAKAVFTVNNGSIDAGLKAAAKTVSQTYSYQAGSRGVIGPACAVADVRAARRRSGAARRTRWAS